MSKIFNNYIFRDRSEKITFLTLLIIASLVFISSLVGVFSNRLTGVRKIKWTSNIESSSDLLCNGGINLQHLVDGETVWTICSKSTNSPAGLAKIYLKEKIGKILWPFPTDHSPYWTLAIQPGPGNRLAIAYKSTSKNNPIIIAIAEDNGWFIKPRLLSKKPVMKLLGLAWNENILEVAYIPGTKKGAIGLFTKPVVKRIVDYNLEKDIVKHVKRQCGNCRFISAYIKDGETDWRFIINQYTDKINWFELTMKKGPPVKIADMIEWETEFIASGVLSSNVLSINRTMNSSGKFIEINKPISKDISRWGGNLYITKDRKLGRRSIFYKSNEPNGRAFIYELQSKEHTAIYKLKHWYQKPSKIKDEHLIISKYKDGGFLESWTVARAYSYAGGALYEGMFVPKSNGWWLVNSRGWYITLDKSLKRTDPLGLIEHLRRRGSKFAGEFNEYYNELMLYWIALGFLILLPLLFILVRKKIKHGVIVSILIFYNLTSILCILKLWPLLS